ncbi:MAG: hypothetical protein WBD04_06495 [Candidatus Omnitrophota bacterium]
MLKRITALFALFFMLACGLTHAEMTREEYQSQTNQLNQQMKQVRANYKGQMRESDKSFMDQFKQLDPKDTEGKKKILEQKKAQKKQFQLQYKKQEKALRDQVNELKQTMKGQRKTKLETKKAKGKAKKTGKKAEKKAEKKAAKKGWKW